MRRTHSVAKAHTPTESARWQACDIAYVRAATGYEPTTPASPHTATRRWRRSANRSS